MLFNSFVFLAFLCLVYSVYLLLFRYHRAQNVLLLVASYVFYGYWDWRFLSLLGISTLVDYFAGLGLQSSQNDRNRKLLLGLSITANLSILAFFKYFNFFTESFAGLLSSFGFVVHEFPLKIILPVGISFYTFQTMSYAIDVYRRKISATSNLLDFALFVAFFPQLVAGPIERASSLLPQIASPRKLTWTHIDVGAYLILWGFFKKVVVADNMALVANRIFNHYPDYQGLDLFFGVLAFTVQIYADFSGYSDIARGISKLMGIDLMINFKLPYFSSDPRDFWSRWHISLSSWLRDYLYIPLGGNRKGKVRTYLNLMLTMVLGGLWHGAAWHFVLWGAYHGTLLSIHRMLPSKRPVVAASALSTFFKTLFMFFLVLIGWIFFRSETTDQMLYIFTHIGPTISQQTSGIAFDVLFYSLPLLIFEMVQHRSGDLLVLTGWGPLLRAPVYAFVLLWIMIFGVRESIEFVYFQF